MQQQQQQPPPPSRKEGSSVPLPARRAPPRPPPPPPPRPAAPPREQDWEQVDHETTNDLCVDDIDDDDSLYEFQPEEDEDEDHNNDDDGFVVEEDYAYLRGNDDGGEPRGEKETGLVRLLSLPRRRQRVPVRECLLTVRCPSGAPARPSHPQQQRQPLPPPTVVALSIQVYPTMTATVLGRCVSQATADYRGTTPSTNYYGGDTPAAAPCLAGLFGETDRIFHSFEHILSLPDPAWQAYCTVLPSKPLPPPAQKAANQHPKPFSLWSLAVDAFWIAAVVGALVGAWFRGEEGLELAWGMAGRAHEWVFRTPFRKLYRHGPYPIGWDSLPLPEICHKITHFGGTDFWHRNADECQRIYAGKEEAFVGILRPLSLGLLLVAAVWLAHSLATTYGEAKRNRTDRAVLEAFHAFQTLVRIAQRQPPQGPRRH